MEGLTHQLNSAGGQVNLWTPYVNWSKAKIFINKAYCSSSADITRETTAHELGHAMGLMHVGRKDFLMYPTDDRTATTPQQDEFTGIAYLY